MISARLYADSWGKRKSEFPDIVPEKYKDIPELAKQYTSRELAEMFNVNKGCIQRYLKLHGVLALRYCKKCDQNRPPEDFSSKSSRTCNRHEPERFNRSRMTAKQQDETRNVNDRLAACR